jgi:hypothetical protein
MWNEAASSFELQASSEKRTHGSLFSFKLLLEACS